MDEKLSEGSDYPALSIIGCGSLGAAILRGLLRNNTTQENWKLRTVWATTGSRSSATRLQASLSSISEDVQLHVVHGKNITAIENSDVVILACPPDKMGAVLGEAGVSDALKGKILISVLAGVTTKSINSVLDSEGDNSRNNCRVVRALPNLAAEMGASTTAIEISEPDLPADHASLVESIFKKLGGVVHVPASLMNACTVMCGSAPAFIALFMDGLVDGAVVAGVPRAEANAMAAQILSSTAALMQNGSSPSVLRESICAMPGCTVKGNLTLEEGGVRVAAAKAALNAIEAASKLG